MTAPNIKVAGIGSIPSGYMLGRLEATGIGDVQLIDLTTLFASLKAQDAGGTTGGITQLTGDATAGPGSGSQATTLATVNANVGSFTSADITVNAKGLVTAAANGSGGGGGSGLFSQVLSAVPTSASTGLSTWLNQGTASVADGATGVQITAPSSAGVNLRVRYKTAPSTPYTITALIANTGEGTNFIAGALGWHDGTKLHVIYLVWSSGWLLAVGKYTNTTTFSANDYAGSANSVPPFTWLRITDDGTTVAFLASMDGDYFRTLFSVAKASGHLGSTGYSNVLFYASPQGAAVTSTLMSWTEA